MIQLASIQCIIHYMIKKKDGFVHQCCMSDLVLFSLYILVIPHSPRTFFLNPVASFLPSTVHYLLYYIFSLFFYASVFAYYASSHVCVAVYMCACMGACNLLARSLNPVITATLILFSTPFYL